MTRRAAVDAETHGVGTTTLPSERPVADESASAVGGHVEAASLYASLRKVLRSRRAFELPEHDLDDVMQEAFVRTLVGSADSSLATARKPLPYLVTAARNVLVDSMRQRRSLPTQSPETVAAQSVGAYSIEARNCCELAGEAEDQRKRLLVLNAYLARLPRALYRVYQTRFMERLSQNAAADALALSRRQLRTLERKLLDGARRELDRNGCLAD